MSRFDKREKCVEEDFGYFESSKGPKLCVFHMCESCKVNDEGKECYVSVWLMRVCVIQRDESLCKGFTEPKQRCPEWSPAGIGLGTIAFSGVIVEISRAGHCAT